MEEEEEGITTRRRRLRGRARWEERGKGNESKGNGEWELSEEKKRIKEQISKEDGRNRRPRKIKIQKEGKEK